MVFLISQELAHFFCGFINCVRGGSLLNLVESVWGIGASLRRASVRFSTHKGKLRVRSARSV